MRIRGVFTVVLLLLAGLEGPAPSLRAQEKEAPEIPGLIEGLGAEDAAERKKCADALAALGPRAVRALVDAGREAKDARLRMRCAEVRDRIVRSAIDRLGRDDWRQRRAAESDLVEMGAAAEPLLLSAQGHHSDVEVRLRAMRVLQVIEAESKFKIALGHLDNAVLGHARRILRRLASLGVGKYVRKARFLLSQISEIARIFPGHDRGQTHFWAWYQRLLDEGRNSSILALGMHYNNLFLFLKAEGIRSDRLFDKAETYYQMILEEEIARGNRRVASCYAALLSAAQKPQKGRAVLDRVKDIPPVNYLEYFDIASFWTYAGDKKKAIAALKKGLTAAVESGHLTLAKEWARDSNDFQGLQDDKEFQKLVQD
jgi:hypothetical protein